MGRNRATKTGIAKYFEASKKSGIAINGILKFLRAALLPFFCKKNCMPGNRGFTIVEFLVVTGLLAIAGSFCVFVNFGDMRGPAFNADRAAALSALRRARGLALAGVCAGAGCAAAKPHGVHFDPSKSGFTLFQGNAFDAGDPANEEVEFENGATRVLAPADAIFMPILANASSTVIIMRDNAGRNATITVGENGRIDLQ